LWQRALTVESSQRVGLQHVASTQALHLAGRQVESVASRRATSGFVPSELSQPVVKLRSGPRWVNEINGYRIAARINNCRVQLLTKANVSGNTELTFGRGPRRQTICLRMEELSLGTCDLPRGLRTVTTGPAGRHPAKKRSQWLIVRRGH
jgi:hypothetical protein